MPNVVPFYFNFVVDYSEKFLSKHKFRGLILDLRLHKGGNMWPTVTGLKSILANVPFYIYTKK